MTDPPPANGEPILRVQDLVRIYPDGEVHALRGVSLAVARGESLAITGPSGCGKSTLLHLMGGLDRPTSGEVFFEGKPLASYDLDSFRARRLGFVFQSFHLLATLTALENVQIPMFEAPWPRAERIERAERLLGEVGLAHRRAHLPSRLSVGERQRVAIARALANDPTLLLADEPTGALDSEGGQEVIELLRRLPGGGQTIILVTHDSSVAAAAERVVLMRDGRIDKPAAEPDSSGAVVIEAR